MLKLSQLFVHPVKSMRGLQLSHAQVTKSGLAFDRIFMLTKTDGTFITARQYPQLVCFTPALISNGIVITAPDAHYQTVLFSDFSINQQPTEVWGNYFNAHIAPDAINQWLSGYLNHPVQLRWVGPQLSRRVKHYPENPLSFADGYPFLLINDASFDDLKQRCMVDVRLEQFRPNLVINGAAVFDEDQWQLVRIGEVVFELVKPCSRCVLTTVNIDNGRKHPLAEPLNTLQQYRTAQNGAIDFGYNLIARNTGVIRIGDTLEVLATHPARPYFTKSDEQPLISASASASAPAPDAKREVLIRYGAQNFVGNNQQVILEQLEQQGVEIPYSCRTGICGCCRLKLIEGEVLPLKQGALRNNDDRVARSVLTCSCVPKGDITLA